MLYERFAGFTRFCRLTGYLCSSLPWLPPLYNLRPSTDCNGKWTGRDLMKKEKVSYKDNYQYLDRIFNRKKHELLLGNEIWWVFGLYFRNLFLGILIYLDLETDIESSNLWAIFPRYILVRFMKAYLPAKPWRGLPISGIRFGHFILCPSNDFSFMVSLRTYFKV